MFLQNESLTERIRKTYERLGKFSSLYDGMITNSSFLGRLAMRFFWGLSDEDYQRFLNQAFAGIPKNLSGRLLKIPVGTGAISLQVYKNLPDAEIFCVDYSETMLNAAKKHSREMNLTNVQFLRGDVGNLPFPDQNFDVILSINGLHVFPDKDAAHDEIRRLLKIGGIFCGSLYIFGQNRRTDFFVKNFCERCGYFAPPFETLQSLNERLCNLYSEVQISHVQSFAGFICRK